MDRQLRKRTATSPLDGQKELIAISSLDALRLWLSSPSATPSELRARSGGTLRVDLLRVSAARTRQMSTHSAGVNRPASRFLTIRSGFV